MCAPRPGNKRTRTPKCAFVQRQAHTLLSCNAASCAATDACTEACQRAVCLNTHQVRSWLRFPLRFTHKLSLSVEAKCSCQALALNSSAVRVALAPPRCPPGTTSASNGARWSANAVAHEKSRAVLGTRRARLLGVAVLHQCGVGRGHAAWDHSASRRRVARESRYAVARSFRWEPPMHMLTEQYVGL